MIAKILKYAVIAAIVFVLGYALLNLSYFGEQIRYYFSHTFVTQNQRDFAQSEEHPIKEPNQIIITSLNIYAPIEYVTETNEAAFQAALINGVVHYPNTADFGEAGNAYIFGHSSDFVFSKGNYKTVFAVLPKIEIGASIVVTNAEGIVFTYKVTDKKVVEKTDLSQLSQDTKGKAILTLQTSYPIGTALKRYIVTAELVKDKE